MSALAVTGGYCNMELRLLTIDCVDEDCWCFSEIPGGMVPCRETKPPLLGFLAPLLLLKDWEDGSVNFKDEAPYYFDPAVTAGLGLITMFLLTFCACYYALFIFDAKRLHGLFADWTSS